MQRRRRSASLDRERAANFLDRDADGISVTSQRMSGAMH